MRELNVHEVASVSGAGFVLDVSKIIGAEAGRIIGSGIGSLIPVPVLSGIISWATGTVGKNIGSTIGGFLGELIENIFTPSTN